MDIIIPIGIYCYFDFDLNLEKLLSFLLIKRKASINAINMSEPTLLSTQDTLEIHNCETLSAGLISLQRRNRQQRYRFFSN